MTFVKGRGLSFRGGSLTPNCLICCKKPNRTLGGKQRDKSYPARYFQSAKHKKEIAMTEFLKNLELISSPEVFLTIIGLGLTLIAMLYALTRSRAFSNALFKLSGLFLYNEPSISQSRRTAARIADLEFQLINIHKMLSSKNVESRRIAIEEELTEQLSRNLPELVAKKLEETKAIDTSIDSAIRKTIEESVSAFLIKQDPTKLIQDRREQLRMIERENRGKILEKTIQDQMLSAGRLKTVMINLFVMFNIGILLTYLFAGGTLTDRAVTGIIGLYVSLAAFIVYIYRTSNFRSSVLLALHEDAKKYFDAEDYIRRLKPGASPNDRDVEVLKLLLLNRAEREKMADHPYELILKGVSNSNIQLKGGKMISSAKGEK